MVVSEEITEEQKQRAEANRVSAIAKRKSAMVDHWSLFKCRKVSSSITPCERFLARLQISSPDSFSVTPLPLSGFLFPGQSHCLHILSLSLSPLEISHYTQNACGGQSCVYKLTEYDMVLKCLRSNQGIDIEEIPWRTFNVVEKFSHSFISGQWKPCKKPEHLSAEEVEELINNKIPDKLLRALLPFQLDGVRFGLQRGGRCLIADEMGLGKTIQAIAIASCFINKGSILVVCPAILRFSWAEELEHWFCLPSDIHLVFCHQDNPANLEKFPKIVVTSYTMLHHLRKSFSKLQWAMLVVDESHHLRCTKKPNESGEVKTVLDLASNIQHIVLLSGTPSLSRPYDIFHQIHLLWPGLLGKNKYDFAKIYCDVDLQGPTKYLKDFTKGKRLEELNVLLTQTVMIRRLKDYVLTQLPPKRRQIINLLLKRSDIVSARTAIGVEISDTSCRNLVLENSSDDNDGLLDSCECRICAYNFNQIIGVAKLSGFCEWLSLHPIMCKSDGESLDIPAVDFHKMIIFCHHHKVLDGVQKFIAGKGVGFIHIDGRTLPGDRQSALNSFRSSSSEVKIAIIGLTVASVGIDLSVAQHVVFLELPQDQATMLQAEDRAHRLGQKKAVNIYIFCAKDTSDERHWQNLNRSLQLVSSVMNGKNETLHEIEVDEVKSFVHSSHPAGVDSNIDSFSSPNVNIKRQEVDNSGHDSLNHTSPDSETEAVENTVVGLTRSPVLDKMGTETCDNNKARALRFEVSRYTKRIHLHACNSETDGRPVPLFRNFRPEEIQLLESSGWFKKKINMKYIDDNPWCKDTLLAFASEWNSLRRVDQRKLFGKPLQLPLSVELCCLDESTNHNSKGLLRGGSNKRRTALSEISHPLPENAVWRKVCLGFDCGRKEKEYIQGWDEGGGPLCKLCQSPCRGVNANTPDFFEDLFCKPECYEEYRLRTSANFLRKELFKIEFGVCTICKLDCHKLVQEIKRLPMSKRRIHVEKSAPSIARRKNILERLVNDAVQGNAWHADHIVPVYKGGGECTLDNMRTLCVSCHADVTANQRGELNSMRANAKKKIKALMLRFQNNDSDDDGDEGARSDERGGVDDDLLIEVPGSSYSCTTTTFPVMPL